MLPLSDSHPTRTFPFINYAIIAATIYAFITQLAAPDFDQFIIDYGFIPGQFSFISIESWTRVLYSIFLHGGIFHIASNLWFLHIFGDNVEDTIGHFQYVLFYILGGVAAVLAQYMVSPDSSIPMIGASGAISAVSGAYFIYYRHSTVKTLVPIFLFLQVVNLPSWLFLGYWFFIQFFSGIGSLSDISTSSGGVAYFAHIGGFVYGVFVAVLLPRKRETYE
jgi:membrane associated rhomboid family serine protease